MQELVAFVAAVLSTAVLTYVVRDFATTHKWLSPPTSDRHIHTRPKTQLFPMPSYETSVAAIAGRARPSMALSSSI